MKKSEELRINQTEKKVKEALEMADSFINTLGLGKKDSIYLHLLSEETIGMIRAMTGDFYAHFWIECEEKEYRVRVTVKTEMDREKKKDLLSVSTSGKNISARGFMGKIGDIIENGLLNYDEVMRLSQEYGGGFINYGFMDAGIRDALTPMIDIQWSLQNYRSNLEHAGDSDQPVQEAWDELEKSIVASLADDVIVGVRKDRADLTIVKKIEK